MAFVCDVYFVRTIDVISEKFRIPDDVAGATLMALGCNGPELALNTIAIFHPSNIGVGAVVGGEVFNVLVIIGTALLATPSEYMPLKLGNFAFCRDVAFYAFSVALLYWALQDGEVSPGDTAILLSGALIYISVVTSSSRIRRFFSYELGEGARELIRSASQGLANSKLGLLSPFCSENPASIDTENGAAGSDDAELDPELVEFWHQASGCKDPSEGCVLAVRADVRNRLMDRGHRVESRYMWLRGDALLVSTVLAPDADPRRAGRDKSSIVYDHDRKARDNHWHHAGLVNQPVFLSEQQTPKGAHELDTCTPTSLSAAFSATPISQLSRPLLNDGPKKIKSTGSFAMYVPPPIQLPGFRDAPWEIIPLEDILYCEHSEDQTNFNLHVHQHDSNLLGKLITLEFTSGEVDVTARWVNAVRERLMEQRRRNTDAPPTKDGLELLFEWVEWLQFPIKFFVARTIPDMDDPKQQHLYPFAFLACMVWLALFAYSIVEVCDGIHDDFGISITALGFTVAAAGTSFPNVFSGMCVARQGKTSMAIANALGANVQNVFLALAIPWAVQSALHGGRSFPMVVDGLLPAVVSCYVTLAPVVAVYVGCAQSMPRWSGGLFLIIYVLYLVVTLGQQASCCSTWPLLSCSSATT
jgi:Ca2+/Na+ antiporter